MSKIIKNNNEILSVAYFGSGWDFRMVDKDLYSKFSFFIYIDSLPTKLLHYPPDSTGYEKCKDLPTFIHTLITKANKHQLKLVEHHKHLRLLIFKTNDHKQELHYYYNTTVQEALDNKIIREKLNKVIWIHEKGFIPWYFGLEPGMLPNTIKTKAKLREYLQNI